MSTVILEIERANGGNLTSAIAPMIGQSLAADPAVLAVWVAKDGNRALRGVPRLQFAVSGTDPVMAAEEFYPVVAKAAAKHRVKVAVCYFTRKNPDVFPQQIADELGVEVTPNHATLVSMIKSPYV